MEKDFRYRYTLRILILLTLGMGAFLPACGAGTGALPAAIQTRRAISAGSEGAQSRPSATPEPTPTRLPSRIPVKTEDLNGIRIRFWHAWNGEAGKTIQAQVDEFVRENSWGIEVQVERLADYDHVYEQAVASILSGDSPNLVVSYPYQATSWGEPADTLVDLNEYLQDPVWGWSQTEQADFYPVFWEADTLENFRYGIPAQRSAQILYYNTTWAKELGFSQPPETPDQFKLQACAAARANRADDDPDNDTTGGWIISTHYSAALGWLHAFGANPTGASGGGYQFDSPPAQKAFTFLRELYDDGCAWLTGTESQNTQDEFATRLGLFAAGTVAGIPEQEAAFVLAGSKDEWVVLPFPTLDGQGVIEVYGPSFQIMQSRPAEELASWLLLAWLVSPQNQARLAQASGFFPVRAASMDQIGLLPEVYPQWQAAAELIDVARAEPGWPSWRIVRWAVSDAATQLFRYYFTAEQVPELLELLEDTAAEFYDRQSE